MQPLPQALEHLCTLTWWPDSFCRTDGQRPWIAEGGSPCSLCRRHWSTCVP